MGSRYSNAARVDSLLADRPHKSRVTALFTDADLKRLDKLCRQFNQSRSGMLVLLVRQEGMPKARTRRSMRDFDRRRHIPYDGYETLQDGLPRPPIIRIKGQWWIWCQEHRARRDLPDHRKAEGRTTVGSYWPMKIFWREAGGKRYAHGVGIRREWENLMVARSALPEMRPPGDMGPEKARWDYEAARDPVWSQWEAVRLAFAERDFESYFDPAEVLDVINEEGDHD